MLLNRDSIAKTVHENGWAVIQNISEDEIPTLCATLGIINGIRELKHPNYVKKKIALDALYRIPYHTDHHSARYLLWHCIESNRVGGASRFIDGLEVLENLSSRTIQILETIQLTTAMEGEKELGKHSMLNENGQNYEVYFGFYKMSMRSDELSTAQKTALREFYEISNTVSQHEYNLAEGEVLIVDNRRMLHGRSALTEDSIRHLIRYWIS